ncbi:MAG: hypothetical protein EOM73_15155 [Bacteroidia bacterium]|nr:hypothetical protein [Bacteroidia bacterium]
MNNTQNISYIAHRNIDVKKWDSCVENASNSRVYALSWHLGRTAETWDALVMGDYQLVMPLPVKKKWGISYLYQPLFCQQLGIFPYPTEDTARLFYLELTRHFRYFNIQINAQNPLVQFPNEIKFLPRKNYLLPLNRSYEAIYNDYSTNTKRNLTKAQKNRLSFIPGIGTEEFIQFKTENLPIKLTKTDLEKLKRLTAFGQLQGHGRFYGVYGPKNDLLSAVYFCRFKNRLTYMNAVSSEEGKALGAMPFLVDQVIRENAGKNLVLDFEGSMIPGVARFYEGFGASPETYFQLKYNRLPLPLKWLKRK